MKRLLFSVVYLLFGVLYLVQPFQIFKFDYNLMFLPITLPSNSIMLGFYNVTRYGLPGTYN